MLELAVALGVMFIAVMGLAGIIVTSSHAEEQQRTRELSLRSAQNVLEEIKGITSFAIQGAYDGRTYSVDGVEGANDDGSTIMVSVDSTTPQFLSVTVTGTWFIRGNIESLTLQTSIYDN